MEYAAIKGIHMMSVTLSYALFFVRGIWMINRSPLLQQRWVRITPHVIDTILLASALTLATMIWSALPDHAWLAAKIIGLVVYIGLGVVALKRGRTPGIRIAAWAAAQAVFFYIAGVAVTRSPLLWLG
jgi:uncharacterized membrane protein SirB2